MLTQQSEKVTQLHIFSYYRKDGSFK